MPSRKIISSTLSFLLLSGSIAGLTIGTHGCSSSNVEQQGLQKENSEILLKDYVGKHTGTLTTFKGIIQGNSPSEAKVELEVDNFYYNSGKSKYSGPALANFTRYTDGLWVMKRFTVNPNNMFGAIWFDTEEKVPTSGELDRIKQENLWSDPLPWAGGLTLKTVIWMLVVCIIMAIPVLFYIFQPKKKES